MTPRQLELVRASHHASGVASSNKIIDSHLHVWANTLESSAGFPYADGHHPPDSLKDAAFGAAHETLAQAVEENMSDDDPERKQFYKTYMPTAALIGGPLAFAMLSPAVRAYRFGKKKSQEFDAY